MNFRKITVNEPVHHFDLDGWEIPFVFWTSELGGVGVSILLKREELVDTKVDDMPLLMQGKISDALLQISDLMNN